MKIRFTALATCLFSVTMLQAQTSLPLKQLFTTNPITVVNPVEIDSVNLKGNKFQEKDLLNMSLSIPKQSQFNQLLASDADGYFPARKPDSNSSLQLYSFVVNSNRYAKGTLKITSPNLLEVYVDGKLMTTKSTREDSIHLAKEAQTSITSYPTPNHIVVKLLSSAKDIAAPCFKVSVENAKDDSLTIFAVNETGKRPINLVDVMIGKRIAHVRVSPDGLYALIAYQNSLGEKRVATTDLYNIKTGKSVLVNTNGTKKQLNWMPASGKLYYCSDSETGTNLITIDPATLQEDLLAENVPSEYFTFSPDEKTLFYSKEEKGEDSKSDLKLLKSPEDRQPGYTNRSFIYKYDIASGLNQQLTFGSHSTVVNDISADSKQIIFSIMDETVTERPFRKYSVFKLDLPTMAIDTLWTNEGFAHTASFSPDGKQILVRGSGEAFDRIGSNVDSGQIDNSYDGQAFIIDLATRKISAITKNFDPSISNAFWSKKDGLIYFSTQDKDYENVYQYNPNTNVYNRLLLSEDVIRNFSVAENAPVAIYNGVSLSNSTRAYLYDFKTKKSTLVSDPYKERLDMLDLGEVKDWNFMNSDGIEITGRYYLPPGFDTSKKYPMIVYYYGGTMPTSRTLEGAYPVHVYAALGYVVYVLQPSGSTGFGQKFSAMHVNAWGKRTAEDIIEGTKKFAEDHPFVNDKKIGCIGASYGGFMTMYLQTKTDIFAAATSHAGISSISSYWGEGYWGYTYSSGASAHSYPWNNTEMYVKQSPLFNADKINTPILLTHGTDDTNVPIGESIQMYTALKILGKPVELLQVKGENHGIANYKRRMEWSNSIFAWFDKWLKDDSNWWNSLYPENK